MAIFKDVPIYLQAKWQPIWESPPTPYESGESVLERVKSPVVMELRDVVDVCTNTRRTPHETVWLALYGDFALQVTIHVTYEATFVRTRDVTSLVHPQWERVPADSSVLDDTVSEWQCLVRSVSYS